MLDEIKKQAAHDINSAETAQQLAEAEKKYLGKKGELTAVLKSLSSKSIEERRSLGNAANILRNEILALLSKKRAALGRKNIPGFDPTEPGEKIYLGHYHILTQVRREIEDYFVGLGFSVFEGPEVESDYYNFEALNIPRNHPARDMWDTFWIKDEPGVKDLLLRTHTSPMQVRFMEKHKPPLAIIVPGRTFRHEATDARHEHTFDQVEGLFVDEHVTAANLKFVLHGLFRHLFGEGVKIKLRPSYFPFTEPSFELIMSCPFCHEKGCAICGSGWMEMLGAGMVHPNVFKAAGYPEGKYQGFAFGIGFARVAMLKYGIPDIRMFYQNDLRFLRQF